MTDRGQGASFVNDVKELIQRTQRVIELNTEWQAVQPTVKKLKDELDGTWYIYNLGNTAADDKRDALAWTKVLQPQIDELYKAFPVLQAELSKLVDDVRVLLNRLPLVEAPNLAIVRSEIERLAIIKGGANNRGAELTTLKDRLEEIQRIVLPKPVLPKPAKRAKPAGRVARSWGRIAVFVLAVILLGITLGIVFFVPHLVPYQRFVLRATLAIAVAGIGAFIPGFLDLKMPPYIHAGGAIALFVLVYAFSPPPLRDGEDRQDQKLPTGVREQAITGRVSDRATRTAISGAEVTLSGRPESAHTDGAGNFSLSMKNEAPINGRVHLFIAKEGYDGFDREVAVGQNVEAELVPTKASTPQAEGRRLDVPGYRPWVTVKQVTLYKELLSSSKVMEVAIELTNPGSKPTMDARITAFGIGTDRAVVPPLHAPQEPLESMMLAPSSDRNVMFVNIPLPDGAERIVGGEMTVFFHFRITYEGQKHHTEFCGYYPAGHGRFFLNCPAGGMSMD